MHKPHSGAVQRHALAASAAANAHFEGKAQLDELTAKPWQQSTLIMVCHAEACAGRLRGYQSST